MFVDNTPPETTFTSGPAPLEDRRAARFAFTANEPVSEFWCSLDGREPQECRPDVAALDLRDGPHVLRVRAVDLAGN